MVERDLDPKNREKILQGARQEFLEHGYAGARIDRIVAKSQVSRATLYRHFADKQELFLELVYQMAQKKKLFVDQNVQLANDDPVEFLKQYANGMLDNIDNDPQMLTFMRTMLGESARFPELARACVENIEKPSLLLLTQYFEAHPELNLPDPEVAARAFIGTLVHFVLLHYVLHGADIVPIERDRLLNSLLDLIIRK